MKKVKIQNADFQVSLKIILKNKKGEILALKTPKSSSLAGYYDLVGGRIREGEMRSSIKKIIDREIKEEIGDRIKYKLKEIPVAIGRHSYFSHTYQKKIPVFWIFFEALYLGGEIKVSSEHIGYSWLKVNQTNLKKFFIKGSLEGMSHYLLKRFPK